MQGLYASFAGPIVGGLAQSTPLMVIATASAASLAAGSALRFLGATFVKVISGYADRLAAAGGRLYLSGLDPETTERLKRTGVLKKPARAFEATAVLGESTAKAAAAAQAWLVSGTRT